MSDVPVQVLVAAFNDEKTANQALKGLKRARRQGLISIKDAAVLRRDAKNKLHIKETGDMSGGRGALLGGVTGGVIGLLAGPVVLAGAAGALVGGLAAKLRDTGFPNDKLEALGQGLKPGSSAIIAVIEHKWVAAVQKELEDQATDIMVQELSSDIAAQLEAGKDVAISALAMQGALQVDRVAGNEESVEASSVTMTEEGMTAQAMSATADAIEASSMTVTEDGVAIEGMSATAEAVELSGLLITEEGAVAAAAVFTAEEEEEAEGETGEKEDSAA
jgi:uncharacterized membrane protein